MTNMIQFVPLKWPDDSLNEARLYHLHKKAQRAFQEMQRQVEDRGPIPPEIWGNDPRRLAVAQQLSRIIKDNVGWTSDNFIPDDPFDLLCWGGMYDLQEIEVLMDIEKHFIINIPENHNEMIWTFTLGQLVDYILANAACPIPWPAIGGDGLEGKLCPSFSAFVDIRKFIQKHCHTENNEFRPSTKIRDLLNDKDISLLKDYICERFVVKPIVVRKRFLAILPPFKTWLVLNILVFIAIHLWLPTLEWHHICALMLPTLFVLGMLVGNMSPMTYREGIVTAGDLIKWILAQRAIKLSRKPLTKNTSII
jgi:hypothetical protein